MVHEQQIVPRRKCKLHQRIGNVLSLAHLRVLKVERQHAKVLANYPDGVDFGAVLLMRRHQLVLLICVRIYLVHVG